MLGSPTSHTLSCLGVWMCVFLCGVVSGRSSCGLTGHSSVMTSKSLEEVRVFLVLFAAPYDSFWRCPLQASVLTHTHTHTHTPGPVNAHSLSLHDYHCPHHSDMCRVFVVWASLALCYFRSYRWRHRHSRLPNAISMGCCGDTGSLLIPCWWQANTGLDFLHGPTCSNTHT